MTIDENETKSRGDERSHGEHTEGLKFWRDQLRGATSEIGWPASDAELQGGGRATVHRLQWDAEFTASVQQLSSDLASARDVVLYALFAAFASRYANQTSVTLGVGFPHSANHDTPRLPGLSPLVTQVGEGESLARLVERVGATLVASHAHWVEPGELKRVTGTQLPFDTVVTFSPDGDLQQVLSDVVESVSPTGDSSRSSLGLVVALSQTGDGLCGLAQFDGDRFDAGTSARIVRAIQRFVLEAVAAPGEPIGSHTILEPEESDQLLTEWGRGAAVGDARFEPHVLFEEWAAREPARRAVVWDAGEWTYGELEKRANQVAFRLREMGVGTRSRVGVSLERSPELVAAVLGILKAGASYVALEPRLPPQRLEYMARDANVEVVVVDEAGERAREHFPCKTLPVSACAAAPELAKSATVPKEAPAYILFTSGSTGRPKGVIVPRGAMRSHIAAMNQRMPVRPDDVVLQKTPLGFDVSMPEIFQALTNGATLAVASLEADRNPGVLVRQMKEFGVTDMRIVPTLLNELIKQPDFSGVDSLRRVISAGEAITPSVRDAFHRASGAQLHNQWGPTEATVYGTYWECVRDGSKDRVPIGFPLDGKHLYVFSQAATPVAQGVAGELMVGGGELAIGYQNNPRETARSFVPDPVGGLAGGRLYSSGDLARWMDAGILAYLGRRDHQVQLRGIRVELGEIEALLEQGDGVESAAVVPVQERDGRADALAAYIVPDAGAAPSVAALREFLSERLDSALVPSSFQFLEAMPRTPSGKIDRGALPAVARVDEHRERVGPRTPMEQAIAECWVDVLGVDEVGIHESLFELGGHSLSVIRIQAFLASELGIEIPHTALYEANTVAELAAYCRRRDGDSRPPPRSLPIEDVPPSAEQRRMWYLQTLDPGSAAYNEPLVFRLNGPLDVAALKFASQELIDRHEIFRTVFPPGADGPIRQVRSVGEPVRWEVISARNGTATKSELTRMIAAPFDLGREPPVRFTLVEEGGGSFVFVMVFHHIAIDDWSLHLVAAELSEIYRATVSGREPSPPVGSANHLEYASRQARRLNSDDCARSRGFWSTHLEGARDRIEWPVGREQSEGAGPAGLTRVRWPAEISRSVSKLAQNHRTTRFSVLSTLWASYLSRFTGQSEVTIGVPVTTRDEPDLHRLVGLLLNTVPLRSRIDLEESFLQTLERSNEAWLRAVDHNWLPLDEIVRATGGARPRGNLPLFDHTFTYVPGDLPSLELGNVVGRRVELEQLPEAKMSLSVLLFDDSEAVDWSGEHEEEGEPTLCAVFEYDTEQFGVTDVQVLASSFQHFVASVLAAPDAPLSNHGLLRPGDRTKIWNWSCGEGRETSSRPFFERIRERVRTHPDREAIRSGGLRLTYGELDRRASAIAAELGRRGVGPEVVVGVSANRSPDLLAALLGVLYAGGAYVALQPDLPEERLQYMCVDSGAVAVLCDSSGAQAADWPVPALAIERLQETDSSGYVAADVGPENLAYVLYTSGSTGRPKGVAMRHAAVANLLTALEDRGLFSEDDVVLWKTPYGFDVSVSELFNPLICGARIVGTSSGDERDPNLLVEFICAEEITVLRMVPTALELLLAAPGIGQVSSLRRIICAGEALKNSVVNEALERLRVQIYNLLGATETCVDTTFWRCIVSDEGSDMVVGRPLANYQTFVVDRGGALAPCGYPGEIWVGGTGLARGYTGLPRRSATSFVPDPFGERPGARLYRTGDLGAWDEQGQLTYSGRVDHQVQVRGIRVELAELESRLRAIPGVRLAAVVAPDLAAGRAETLVAFVQVDDDFDLTTLRSHLERYLPEAVIPSRFVSLDDFPTTPSGKIDRRQLPTSADFVRSENRTAPQTDTQKAVARLWKESLGLDEVGIDENFFEIGGHSLLAVRIQHELSAALNVEIPLAQMVRHPTVASLAEWVDVHGMGRNDRIERHLYGEVAPLSSDQRRMWFLQRLDALSTAYHVGLSIRIHQRVDPAMMRAALRELVGRHEILRTVYPLDQDEPVQRVLPPETEHLWQVSDLRFSPDAEAGAREIIADRFREPFDLESDVPFRATLVQLADDEFVLALVLHHIAIDEWSLMLLLDELFRAYSALSRGESFEAPAPIIQYADYAIWQRGRLKGEDYEEGLQFWDEYLRGARHAVDWPTEVSGEEFVETAGMVNFEWSSATSELVKEIARAHRLSPFIVLLTLYASFLRRISGQSDFTIGVPVTGRDRPELQNLVGLVLNTVPLRVRAGLDSSFEDLLDSVRKDWERVVNHSWVPLDEIVQHQDGGRRPSNPLFDTMFTVLPAPAAGGTWQESFEYLPPSHAKASLVAAVSQGEESFDGYLEYDRRRFDPRTVERLCEQFTHFVNSVLARPTDALGLHAIESRSTLDLLREWARGEELDVSADPFPVVFAQRAKQSPDRPALLWGDRKVSYGTLDSWANEIATALLDRGVKPTEHVGLSCRRSPELVAGIVGIMRAGCAYVPLEPTLPVERLRFIVEDAGIRAAVCDASGAKRLGELPGPSPVVIDATHRGVPVSEPQVVIDPSHLAYILYTSGTTGRPKGVMMTHRGLSNLSSSYALREYGLPGEVERRCMALKASPTFDMFVAELFPPLLAGCSVSILEEGAERAPRQMSLELTRHGVTDLWSTPTMLAMLVEGGVPADLRKLRHVYSGGEALTPALANSVRSAWDVELWNLYGPTEMCVGQTSFLIGEVYENVPLGRATINHEVWVVDRAHTPASMLFDGEIMIAGAGEARGYLNMPARTATSFVPHVGGRAGARAYRTGDIGRWNTRGELEYRGRNDDQLQVQGVRVELAEIEACLEAVDSVGRAAVLPVNPSNGRADALVAYIQPRNADAPPDPQDVLAQLRTQLSDAVLPRRIELVEEMPLMASGKIDRKMLSGRPQPSLPEQPIWPRNETEERVARIWCRYLSVEKVGVNQDFYGLGGHSLLAVRLLNALRAELGVEIDLVSFMERPTIEDVAIEITLQLAANDELDDLEAMLRELENEGE